MTSQPSFMDFCKYIVSKKEDPDTDLDSLVEFFLNFLEPFAAESEIDLPDDLIELIEACYEADEASEDDEEEEADEDEDDEEEEEEASEAADEAEEQEEEDDEEEADAEEKQ